MDNDIRTLEDDVFENVLIKKVAYKATPFDPMNSWLDKHSALYAPTPTMKEREVDEAEGFQEKLDRVFRHKRFTYQVWYAESGEWSSLGKHDVDDKIELQDLMDKLEKKYKSEIKSELIVRNW